MSPGAAVPSEGGGGDGPARAGFGAWLRRQREARGIALREIAESTKISTRYLEALEQDRFDILPAQVFTRGFLREYASYVGLDPDEVVNHYLLARQKGEPSARDVRPQMVQGAPRAGWSSGVLLALAVAAFLGLATWLTTLSSRAPSAAAPAPRPAVADSPAADSAAGSPLAKPSSPGSALPGGGAPLRVVVEFNLDCWVEFVVDGTRRTSELRAGGESLTIDAAESVEFLTLGNADAVRIEVDGRPFPLEPGQRVVRNLRIDRSTLAGSSSPPTA